MRQRTRRILVVALCLCTLGQAFITPVVAQAGHEDTQATAWPGVAIFADSGNNSDSGGLLQQGGNTILDAAGAAVRTADSVKQQVSGNSEEDTAETYARDTAAAIEDNDAALRTLANEEFDADSSDEVVRIQFADEAGDTATRYLVADADDGQWEDGPRVLTPEEFAATDRSADHWVTLDAYASRHISDDVEQLATLSEDEDNPSKAMVKARLAANYGSGVESDLLGDE